MNQRELDALLHELEKAGVIVAGIAGMGLVALGAALQAWAASQRAGGQKCVR